MKVALCSTIVPFVDGGARMISDWLHEHLVEHGHQVERVYLPEVDMPSSMYRQMMAFRLVDLDAADRIICFRPQSHMIRHPNKVLWFIHHVRVLYDLWDSPYREFPDDDKNRGIRDAVRSADTAAIAESRAVFTNSRVVSERLRRFNGLESEVLYPPVFRPERFSCGGFGDEVVYVSRVQPHKRQHLLVEALQYTRTPVKLRICGTTPGGEYAPGLQRRIAQLGLTDRVRFDLGWIPEEEKAELLRDCLAVAYIPSDEDSYGYPTLEAAHSGKPVLTTTDSGGVLEFVEHGVHGLIAEPSPRELADAMDRFFLDRASSEAMGAAATTRVAELGINWPHVIERLLA